MRCFLVSDNRLLLFMLLLMLRLDDIAPCLTANLSFAVVLVGLCMLVTVSVSSSTTDSGILEFQANASIEGSKPSCWEMRSMCVCGPLLLGK